MDDYIDDAIQTQFTDSFGGYEIVHDGETRAQTHKGCPLDAEENPELAARCNNGEWIPSRNEVDSFRLMDDYIPDEIQVQQKDSAGGFEIDHTGRSILPEVKKNCLLADPKLEARCEMGEWIPSKNEIDKFRQYNDYIDDNT